MKSIVFAFVVLVAFASVDATIYDKCGLAKKLSQYFPKDQLSNWVCLVESESSGNTAAKGPPNSDGSVDYGLFQINNRYWCQGGSPGHGCNIDCNRLLDDNIDDDVKCVKIIFKISGFGAWNGWKRSCQGPLPDLSGCGV